MTIQRHDEMVWEVETRKRTVMRVAHYDGYEYAVQIGRHYGDFRALRWPMGVGRLAAPPLATDVCDEHFTTLEAAMRACCYCASAGQWPTAMDRWPR